MYSIKNGVLSLKILLNCRLLENNLGYFLYEYKREEHCFNILYDNIFKTYAYTNYNDLYKALRHETQLNWRKIIVSEG